MQRTSRQRESIIEYLRSTKEHPCAEAVYQHIRAEHPRVSLGTVYRNLSLLVSTGEINRVFSLDGLEHFDADTSLHYHFICRGCGRIQDVPMMTFSDIDRLAGIDVKGQIEGHAITFFGYCSTCLQKQKQ
jgi:Fur family peroxide stress response transcriptional regulator